MRAGSPAGPARTKSLYITATRARPTPAAISFSSSSRLWVKSTSTSPFSAYFITWPVPATSGFTFAPLAASKPRISTASTPESCRVCVAPRRSSAACAQPASSSARPAIARRTRATSTRDREEQLLVVHAERRDGAPSLGARDPLDELHGAAEVHVGMPGGVHGDHAVGVEHALVAFDQELEAHARAIGGEGGAVAQRVGADVARHREHFP